MSGSITAIEGRSLILPREMIPRVVRECKTLGSEEQVEAAEMDYLKFMHLAAEQGGKPVVPTLIIDHICEMHMCYPSYRDDCRCVSPCPFERMMVTEITDGFWNMFQCTQKLWEQKYGKRADYRELGRQMAPAVIHIVIRK